MSIVSWTFWLCLCVKCVCVCEIIKYMYNYASYVVEAMADSCTWKRQSLVICYTIHVHSACCTKLNQRFLYAYLWNLLHATSVTILYIMVEVFAVIYYYSLQDCRILSNLFLWLQILSMQTVLSQTVASVCAQSTQSCLFRYVYVLLPCPKTHLCL